MSKYLFLLEVDFGRELDPDEAQQIRDALESFIAGEEIAEMLDLPVTGVVTKGPVAL
jgi:hypothetical protein